MASLSVSRWVGLGFGPLGPWIRRPLVVALGELGLAHVVQHVLDQLLSSSWIATGRDAWSKSLDHIPHSREAEATRLQARFLSGQIDDGTHQVVGQQTQIHFLGYHGRSGAGQF